MTSDISESVPGAFKQYKEYKKYIEQMLETDFLNRKYEFKDFSLGKTIKERAYRKWVLDEKLFLNVLCEIGCETAFAHDVISMPNIIIDDNSPGPKEIGFYNQLKQEFISARFLFYSAVTDLNDDSYVNNDINIIDTLDYPEYGINSEKARIAFRISYSLLDKISYFLYLYLDLDRNPDKVNFRNVWGKKENNVYTVDSKIRDTQNWALHGLFWLSKDIWEDDIMESIEPDAKDLKVLRNQLEHKYLKLHMIDISEPKNYSEKLYFDAWAHSTEINDFFQKTKKLLHISREALIYLSLLVHIEEQKKTDDAVKGIDFKLLPYQF